jgi:putative hydrolase of the HAD superfamily
MSLPFDAVFFDVGYTLVWFYPSVEELVVRAWNDAGLRVTVQQLQEAFTIVWERTYRDAATAFFPATEEHDRQAWFQREREIMHLLGSDDERMLEAYAASYEAHFRSRGAIRLYDDALPVLAGLKARGFRLGIISNWSWNLIRRCQQVGIAEYFEVIMASAYAGCDKPNPTIFQMALEKMSVPASRAVHVGDRYDADVVGARAAGMIPVLLDRDQTAGFSDCLVIQGLGNLLDWLDRAR